MFRRKGHRFHVSTSLNLLFFLNCSYFNRRLSLPASLLEPIPNLEYWHYLDRPDFFASYVFYISIPNFPTTTVASTTLMILLNVPSLSSSLSSPRTSSLFTAKYVNLTTLSWENISAPTGTSSPVPTRDHRILLLPRPPTPSLPAPSFPTLREMPPQKRRASGAAAAHAAVSVTFHARIDHRRRPRAHHHRRIA